MPFIKKGKDLKKLNILQLYIQRYGIGNTLSNTINKHTCIHKYTKFNTLKENDLNILVKYLFMDVAMSLDATLENITKKAIKKKLYLYNYQGSMYFNRLPMHGQSKRSNRKTARRVRFTE